MAVEYPPVAPKRPLGLVHRGPLETATTLSFSLRYMLVVMCLEDPPLAHTTEDGLISLEDGKAAIPKEAVGSILPVTPAPGNAWSPNSYNPLNGAVKIKVLMSKDPVALLW
jgi:hypothetical protein